MFESEPLTTAELAAFLERLPALDITVPDPECIDQLALLESVKGACAAAQARVSVAFNASQRAAQAAAGVPARRRGRGVAEQIALSRRESPHQGSRHLGFAKAMVNEMPHTMEHLASGRTSEWRATIICRETACLPVEQRAEVDRRLAADLPTMSDRQVERSARALAAELDPAAVAQRASKAAIDRCVTLRPAPDAMTYLTALLPVAQGVAAYAALHRAALTAAAGGDERSKGQVMADALVERVTGQACAGAVPLEVNLVMPFDTMAGWSDEPAEVVGCGAVPADTARALLATSADNEAAIWFRRLFTSPDGSQLVALDSRARLFPAGLRRFLTLRDKTCSTPWCDAPIRDHDHVEPAGKGGATSAANGRGACQTCNLAKEELGWRAELVSDGLAPGSPHRVRLRTPTGHVYESTAPPLLETRRPQPAHPNSRLELLLEEWTHAA